MITWEFSPLPADGSADGTYTIRVKAVSKSGITKDYSSTFLYDTKAPTLTSITPADGSVLITAPTQVIIKVSDGTGSGINFVDSRSSMTLSSVSNIIKSDNGIDTMTFSFAALGNTGEYTINITLKDKAGNANPLSSRFRYCK